jgi:hypothetical protein
MKKQFITIRQFAELLMSYNGSKFAQAQSVTEPKLNKKNRETGELLPFKTVLNCRNINVQLNFDYEGQINRREIKEGAETPEFQATEHSWARHFKGALAVHKSELASDIMDVDLSKAYMPYVKIRVDSQQYIADGKVISKDALTPFMPPKNDYDNQPVENKVRVEYMKLSSIKTFVTDGCEYQIVG